MGVALAVAARTLAKYSPHSRHAVHRAFARERNRRYAEAPRRRPRRTQQRRYPPRGTAEVRRFSIIVRDARTRSAASRAFCAV